MSVLGVLFFFESDFYYSLLVFETASFWPRHRHSSSSERQTKLALITDLAIGRSPTLPLLEAITINDQTPGPEVVADLGDLIRVEACARGTHGGVHHLCGDPGS